MVKIKLQKDPRLDLDATRKKMNELGFEIYFDNYPESVNVRLTDEGDAKYKTEDEAMAALCNGFIFE